MFRSGFIILLIHPLQLMWNDSSDAAGVVIVTQKLLVVGLFSRLSLSFTLFHKYFDQVNVVLEAVVLGDEQIENVELVGVVGEDVLGLLQL